MVKKAVLINLESEEYEIAKERVKGSFSAAIRQYVRALASNGSHQQRTLKKRELELQLEIKQKKYADLTAEILELQTDIDYIDRQEKETQLTLIKLEAERLKEKNTCKVCHNEIMDDPVVIGGQNVCKACFHAGGDPIYELLRGENAS